MRWVLAMALCAIAGSAAAQDAEKPPPVEPGQERLIGVSRSSRKDDEKLFPNGAPVSGLVWLRCTVTDTGRLADCAVAKETAPGSGLAEAALKQAELFRFKTKDKDGRSVVGQKVIIGQRYLAKGDKDPEWLKKPTEDNLSAVYPVKASKEGKDGRAVIGCRVTLEGFLDRCRVDSETPEGYGFGQAALALTPQFRMSPRVRNGAPVEAEVHLPVQWGGMESMPSYALEKRFIAQPQWSTAPSPAAVKAAYPARAASEAKGGQALLRCGITRTGKLSGCDITSEIPSSRGFGMAAKSLMEQFTLDFTLPANPASLKSINVDVPFRFRNPTAPDDGRLTDVRWTQTLSADGVASLFPQAAASAGVMTGVGYVDCSATAQGALVDCKATKEEPVGKGFGDAALEAAKLLKMNPWTNAGDPVDGRRILLPIRFKIEPPATEAKP